MCSATNGKSKMDNLQLIFTHFSRRERDMTEGDAEGAAKALVIVSSLSPVIEKSVFVLFFKHTHTQHKYIIYIM